MILLGVFILLVLIIVSLGKRIRVIRVTAGVVTVLVEFGLTPEELEAEIMSNLVRLRTAAATDIEFRRLAEPIIFKYLSRNNNPRDRDIYMPRKMIRGRAENGRNYLPPPPPPLPPAARSAPPPPPPPPSA
jgi:hypothetical protein